LAWSKIRKVTNGTDHIIKPVPGKPIVLARGKEEQAILTKAAVYCARQLP
jgi:hypothetical protein